MLLLYQMWAEVKKHSHLIYIPLCFYFIRRALRASCSDSERFTFHYASTLSRMSGCMSPNHHNLHSTMLLLYPISRFASEAMNRIYIPLCFYFIELQSIRFLHHIHLHSTMLLLYLTGAESRAKSICYLHSTMLLLYPWPSFSSRSMKYEFTFHYASTLS